MGVVTRNFHEHVDSILTECYVYKAIDGPHEKSIKRVLVPKALWDTGASCSLVSSRVVKALELVSVGKSGVSGYNNSLDIKDTFHIHIGLPTGDIVTNLYAMECADNDDFDVIIGMDVIGNGDFVITNNDNTTKFTFRVPSQGINF
ncbi:MAG: hypothetical protein MJZ66_06975 [Bacteroidales bacterium]|nr:hypothetical protein [Bacteroidales bacterium]